MNDLASLAEGATAIAREAGEAILRVYAGPFATSAKSDRSPVTQADLDAEAIIRPALVELTPNIAIISEEAAETNGLPETAPSRFWLVDPLDGTKEFIARNDDFTVNIALIEGGRSILGVVHVPAREETYRGYAGRAERSRAQGEFETLRARRPSRDGLVLAISRSHANNEMAAIEKLGLRVARTIVAGSSLKFCRLAEGNADLYPRLGPTMEWDTAAGQAVLEAAGGTVRTMDGLELGYGKKGFRNPHFIARGLSD
jgi:3'(2'), 5'-bisphosphate nucleotidase